MPQTMVPESGRLLFVDMAGDEVGSVARDVVVQLASSLGVHCDVQRFAGPDCVSPVQIDELAIQRQDTVAVLVLRGAVSTQRVEALSTLWQGRFSAVLLVASATGVDAIERAFEVGLHEFCAAPVDPAELAFRVKRMLWRFTREEHDVQELKERLGLKQIVGRSHALLSILERLPLLARSGATILLRGETGTGKEMFARAVHYLSPRSDQGFVPVNCGAVPADLLENELFGHAAGAFTGAGGARDGLVAEAEGGTLFLDEIDALPLAAQVKLLRLLQEKEFRPLGAARVKKADIRVLAASNTNLEGAIAEGRFRRDLYYRLDVLALELPALRDRADDIPLLAQCFASRFGEQYGKRDLGLSVGALGRLLAHDWPGNVRELENVIERAAILCRATQIGPEHIEIQDGQAAPPVLDFRHAKAKIVTKFERDYLSRLLAMHDGNITRAARTAGKNRRALFELIRKHRIRTESFGQRP